VTYTPIPAPGPGGSEGGGSTPGSGESWAFFQYPADALYVDQSGDPLAFDILDGGPSYYHSPVGDTTDQAVVQLYARFAITDATNAQAGKPMRVDFHSALSEITYPNYETLNWGWEPGAIVGFVLRRADSKVLQLVSGDPLGNGTGGGATALLLDLDGAPFPPDPVQVGDEFTLNVAARIQQNPA
jgi:hypothetical protein